MFKLVLSRLMISNKEILTNEVSPGMGREGGQMVVIWPFHPDEEMSERCDEQ